MALLASALHDPSITAGLEFNPANFYSGIHESLWRAISDLHGLGISPDIATVLSHLNFPAHLSTAVADLMVEVATFQSIPSNAEHYAKEVAEQGERRRLLTVIAGIRQRLEADEVPLPLALDRVDQLALNMTTTAEDEAEHLLEVDEFIDQPDTGSSDWVIPELLTRNDRLILTGLEGAGKAILMRQIGICAAAGLDPFTLRSIPPARVLLIDYENPEMIVKDTLRRLRAVLRARGATLGSGSDKRMWVRLFPQGVDFAEHADRQTLEYLISLTNPDLLLIGPAYKMYIGGSNSKDEDLARTVASELDRLRAKYGFALILEHHSPHGGGGDGRSVRPFGSSLWMRWPEFGFGIRPEVDTEIVDRRMVVKHWRGARAERRWPERLIGGGEGELLWVDPDRMGYWGR